MHAQIEVVYENGVLRPLAPLPDEIQENQHLNVTIDDLVDHGSWLADANPTVSLDAVRQALAKIPGTLAQAVRAEREDR